MNLNILPPAVRKVVYAVSVVLSAGATATLAYFTAVGAPYPLWLVGGLAALGAVGLVPSGLALANVSPTVPQQPAPVVVDAQPVADDPDLSWTPGDESETGL